MVQMVMEDIIEDPRRLKGGEQGVALMMEALLGLNDDNEEEEEDGYYSSSSWSQEEEVTEEAA